MHMVAILMLMGLGGAGFWYGLVEGFKLGFLVGLLSMAAAVFLVFSSGANPASKDQHRDHDADAATKTLGLSALILTGLAAAAAGLWYALVDDVEVGFAAGLLVLAGTTVTAFRGKFVG